MTDALQLLDLAEGYGLWGVEFATALTDDALRAAYNGLGPAWFPAKLRDALGRLDPVLLPAALIHDVQYTYGARCRAAFHNFNRTFALNGRIIADATYRWYDPRRYLTRRRARAYAALCDAFGWEAYRDAGQTAYPDGGFAAPDPDGHPDDFNTAITRAILSED